MTRDQEPAETDGAVPGQQYLIDPCDRGPCAAPRGHEGTCTQASGWDE